MILEEKALDYWLSHVDREDTFRTAYMKLKRHFETEPYGYRYYHDWTQMSIASLRAENRTLTDRQLLQKLFDILIIAQEALGEGCTGDGNLQVAIWGATARWPRLKGVRPAKYENAEVLMQRLLQELDISSAEPSLVSTAGPRRARSDLQPQSPR